MTKTCERFWTTILALALSAGGAWAQQKDPRVNPPAAPQQPLPTGESSSKASQQGSGTPAEETSSATPDTRPLSGAEQFTLGQMSKTRSYLLASGNFSESADSNSDLKGNSTNFTTVSSFSGHMELHRVWSRYDLMTDYTGGGSIYKSSSGLNSTFHQFGLTQRIVWPRWSLKLNDYLGYLPESSFGFNSNLPGVGGNLVTVNPLFNQANLSPGLIPSQTIFTIHAPRISNTAVGEVEYKVSSRSSITATGSYGILHFSGAEFINSNNAAFRTGYNHSLSARDSIAVAYGFSRFWFGGRTHKIDDHSVLVSYGRRLTGRLALQLSAGPELYKVSDPVSGSGRRLTWTAQSGLTYRFQRSYLTVSYGTYLAGGSGVLAGAQSHSVQMTVTRQLSRMWSGSLNAGFARNTALLGTTTQTSTAFNSWYGGSTLSRPLGRYTNLFLNYQMERQTTTTNAPCITGGICSASLLRHHFGLGFDLHSRPIRLD